MKYNTYCKNCLFSHPDSEDSQCDFDIISNIKNTHECYIKDNYWYINNYQCKFAFGHNTYNENIKNILNDNSMDIHTYIKLHNTIRYYLVLDCKNLDYSFKDLCEYLERLTIYPTFMAILLYVKDKDYLLDAINQLKNIIADRFEYKVHNFIEELSIDEALFSVLETTVKKNNTQYLWLLDTDHLQYSIEDDSIAKINYQINIIQPQCNLLKSKISKDYFNTLFLNFDNYTGMTKNINQSLSLAIQSMPNILIENYD